MTICPRCGRGEAINKYKIKIKQLENKVISFQKRIDFLEGKEYFNECVKLKNSQNTSKEKKQ